MHQTHAGKFKGMHAGWWSGSSTPIEASREFNLAHSAAAAGG